MDYLAKQSKVGIRVSDDERLCWLLIEHDSKWEVAGDPSPVSNIPETDDRHGTYSSLKLVCELLSWQNPPDREKLRDVVRRNSSPH
jgi:hypothetical protein